MSPLGFAAVALGAAFGAWLRWGLSLLLNPLHLSIPLGTLAANLIGGYLMGLALVWSAQGGVSQEQRLLVMTGFLGGLTTFSSFSAETLHLLLRGQGGWALAEVLLHVLGSLFMTWLGVLSAQALRAS